MDSINKKLKELNPNLSLELEKGKTDYVSRGCFPRVGQTEHYSLKLLNGGKETDSIDCRITRHWNIPAAYRKEQTGNPGRQSQGMEAFPNLEIG